MGSSFVLVAACSVSWQKRGLRTKGNLDQDGFSCIFWMDVQCSWTFLACLAWVCLCVSGVYTGSMKQFFGKTTLWVGKNWNLHQLLMVLNSQGQPPFGWCENPVNNGISTTFTSTGEWVYRISEPRSTVPLLPPFPNRHLAFQEVPPARRWIWVVPFQLPSVLLNVPVPGWLRWRCCKGALNYACELQVRWGTVLETGAPLLKWDDHLNLFRDHQVISHQKKTGVKWSDLLSSLSFLLFRGLMIFGVVRMNSTYQPCIEIWSLFVFKSF